jgi:hypothetical protein
MDSDWEGQLITDPAPDPTGTVILVFEKIDYQIGTVRYRSKSLN